MAALLVAGCGAPALPSSDATARPAFEAELVERGRTLAAVGNCRGCHTPPGGHDFAGGEPMHSGFGTIYSTNITPDPETGIGRWSFEAFNRAMRSGVRADGKHLYPAFPYDRLTRVTDEDNRALYAYLMSQPAVSNRPPPNELPFPFNVRAGIGLWKALYFREGPRPAPERETELTRGEYLVEGLGHCGSCHSPRNFLYAEKKGQAYDGGELQGWHAYAINQRIAAPVPWDAAALAFYLRNGFHPRHGIARGTMGLVTAELAGATAADLQAMAAYTATLMGPMNEERRVRSETVLREPVPRAALAMQDEGARLYRATCHECHDGRRELPFGGLPLRLSLGLHGDSPRNLVNVILHGIAPAEGSTAPMMPGYLGALDDAQVETLVRWLRANLTDKAEWKEIRRAIAESRDMRPAMLSYPPGGTGADPARTASRQQQGTGRTAVAQVP